MRSAHHTGQACSNQETNERIKKIRAVTRFTCNLDCTLRDAHNCNNLRACKSTIRSFVLAFRVSFTQGRLYRKRARVGFRSKQFAQSTNHNEPNRIVRHCTVLYCTISSTMTAHIMHLVEHESGQKHKHNQTHFY